MGVRKKQRQRHRNSKGGLSALFVREAAIEYRYLQFREPRLRPHAKINEPITEVGTRLVPSCL